MRAEDLDNLVQSAANRDAAAFAQLVRRFKGMVLGIALSRVRDWHLAEDVAQETFVEAYLELPKLRSSAAFPPWLRRIAIKQCDRVTRRRVPNTANVDATARDGDPLMSAQRLEMQTIVIAALEKLPQPERDVIAMFYLQGRRVSDVARFLGTSSAVVSERSRPYRAGGICAPGQTRITTALASRVDRSNTQNRER